MLAAVLVWLGPPGSDLAEHAYQRTLFLNNGFALWNNFWYAGRYSFVTYSTLYYPLAALFGIRLLAVATVSTAALAFAVVVSRQWGPTARWSSRTFAVVWSGIVFSAAFPFGIARWDERRALLAPALTIAAFGVVEIALWRAFPGSGQYPFSWQELLAALVFCFLGLAMSWRVERAGPLWWMFVVYLVAVLG